MSATRVQHGHRTHHQDKRILPSSDRRHDGAEGSDPTHEARATRECARIRPPKNQRHHLPSQDPTPSSAVLDLRAQIYVISPSQNNAQQKVERKTRIERRSKVSLEIQSPTLILSIHEDTVIPMRLLSSVSAPAFGYDACELGYEDLRVSFHTATELVNQGHGHARVRGMTYLVRQQGHRCFDADALEAKFSRQSSHSARHLRTKLSR